MTLDAILSEKKIQETEQIQHWQEEQNEEDTKFVSTLFQVACKDKHKKMLSKVSSDQ